MTEANFTDEEAERRAEGLRAMLERVRRARNKNGENLTFVQMLREMADVMEHQKVSVLDLEGMEKALTPRPVRAHALPSGALVAGDEEASQVVQGKA